MPPHIPTALESVAHVIQLALTPVFLLSGIAALLNVFSTRFARIADQVEVARQSLKAAEGEERDRTRLKLRQLDRRSLAMELAVMSGASGGVATGVTTLSLFLGATRDWHAATILFLSFGAAVIFTVLALAAYLVEMLMASQAVRAEARRVFNLR